MTEDREHKEGGMYMACNECDTVMIRNGAAWKCLNCGGTAGTLTAEPEQRDISDVEQKMVDAIATLRASLAAAERERDTLKASFNRIEHDNSRLYADNNTLARENEALRGENENLVGCLADIYGLCCPDCGPQQYHMFGPLISGELNMYKEKRL